MAAWSAIGSTSPISAQALVLTQALEGDNSGNGIAWSPDGRHLAVKDGPTLAILDLDDHITVHQAHLPVPTGCTLPIPPTSPVESNWRSSRPARTLPTAGSHHPSRWLPQHHDRQPGRGHRRRPERHLLQALSPDISGQHILVGVAPIASTRVARRRLRGAAVHGKLVTPALPPRKAGKPHPAGPAQPSNRFRGVLRVSSSRPHRPRWMRDMVVAVRCPMCSRLDDKVVDSRLADDGGAIRRRRECLGCGRRFTTYERSRRYSSSS